MSPTDERTWALWAHLGTLLAAIVTGFFSWVAPLIIMQTRGRDSAFVRDQSVESLNFQLSLLIVNIGGFVLFFATIVTVIVPILIALGLLTIDIAALTFMILGQRQRQPGRALPLPGEFPHGQVAA
jgi:uncharacterized protein